MTCLQYLNNLGSALVLTQEEKNGIAKSVDFLKANLSRWEHFNDTDGILIFGSYSRDTILPRWADESSDVDLMVIFKGGNLNPQTHLNWIRAFAESYYSRSSIKQSSPTIVLELNHIKFEITPALKLPYVVSPAFQIPAPASGYIRWMRTCPTELRTRLLIANYRCSYLLKPLIRLLKYANVRMGKVFSSYEIEEYVLRISFYGCSNLEDMFYFAVQHWTTPWEWPQYKKAALNRLKADVAQISSLKRSGYEGLSLKKIQRLLPY